MCASATRHHRHTNSAANAFRYCHNGTHFPSPSPLPRSGLASSSLRSAAGSGSGLAAAQRPADTSAAPAARLPLALARARESLAALREELRKEAAAVEAESRAGGGLG